MRKPPRRGVKPPVPASSVEYSCIRAIDRFVYHGGYTLYPLREMYMKTSRRQSRGFVARWKSRYPRKSILAGHYAGLSPRAPRFVTVSLFIYLK